MDSTATSTALLKIPNEIWFRIFWLAIGPVPFERTQPSVERALSPSMVDYLKETLGAYELSEQKRYRLMLVCNYWKSLADALDPPIVFSARIGNTDYIFPYRHYIEYQRTQSNDSKTPSGNRNVARAFRTHFKSTSWHEFVVTRTAHGDSRAITVFACYSQDLLEIDYANVHVLSILKAYKSNQIIRTMLEPAFQHLLVLYLSITDYISPSIPSDHLTLPELRRFHIWSILPIERPAVNISTWRFPKLVTFGAEFFEIEAGFRENLLDFLQIHGPTLKVFNMSRYTRVQIGRVWEYMTQLEYSRVDISLETLLEELPGLRRRSTAIHSRQSIDGSGRLEPPIPLRLAIRHPVRKDTIYTLKETLTEYVDVFRDVILVLSEYRWNNDALLSQAEIQWRRSTYGPEWNEISVVDWAVKASPAMLDVFRDFLDVVEQADLPVEDAVGIRLTHSTITDIKGMLGRGSGI